jgi:hypothetical protein
MATARPNRPKRGRGRPRIKLPNQTIARFYRDGATVVELAALWGVSEERIRVALHDAGIGRRPRSAPDLSLPDGGIGLSQQSMAYHRRRARGSRLYAR